MSKVLIISYFFPPCGLTASRRVESWAKELSKMGYEVKVISRKWEHSIESFDDIHRATSLGSSTEQVDGYSLTSVPYIPNLRDRLLTKRKSSFIRKILTIWELFSQNFYTRSCPYYNIYEAAEASVKQSKPDIIIISGNPFLQFKFGYLLNKKHGVKWIADYRDAWTTSTINHIGRSALYKIYQSYDRRFERKWIRTASLVTASSFDIGKSVTELTNVKSTEIYNGFDKDLFKDYTDVQKLTDTYQIAYIGTLYSGQDITVFLNGFKLFLKSNKPNTKVVFPGLATDEIQAQRIQQEMLGFESYFEITERIPHTEVLKIEKESHLLLHVAWKGHNGIIASKIYEYIGSGTTILIAPGDDGAIDNITRESGIGTTLNTAELVAEFLSNQYALFINDSKSVLLSEANPSTENFTRQCQAKKFEQEIKKLTV